MFRLRHVLPLAAFALIFASPLPAPAQTVIDEWANVKAPPAPELKPVTVDPKTTALLLIDFIPGIYCADTPHCLASLPAMKQLLAAARGSGATVIYSVAGQFGPADILKDVAPAGSEPSVKSHADKFIDTDLEKLLKDKGIQTVIVTGTSANGGVLYTGSGAALRGLQVIVPVDGLSAKDSYARAAHRLATGPRSRLRREGDADQERHDQVLALDG